MGWHKAGTERQGHSRRANGVAGKGHQVVAGPAGAVQAGRYRQARGQGQGKALCATNEPVA